MSSNRPRTNIGPQGSHVTAFIVIDKLAESTDNVKDDITALKKIFHLLAAIEGSIRLDMELCRVKEKERNKLKVLAQEIHNNLIAFQACFEQFSRDSSQIRDLAASISTLINNSDHTNKKEMLDFIQAAAVPRYSQALRIDATKYLKSISNRYPKTAYPSEGNQPSIYGEGALIKASFNQLKTINSRMAGNKNLHPRKDEIDKHMLGLFWYPKISQNNLLKWNDKIRKTNKYNKDVEPRNNELHDLIAVASRHVDLLSLVFPDIFTSHRAQEYIDSFLNLVGKNGKINKTKVGWNLDSETLQQFIARVKDRLSIKGVIYRDAELDVTVDSDSSQSPKEKESEISPTIGDSSRDDTFYGESPSPYPPRTTRSKKALTSGRVTNRKEYSFFKTPSEYQSIGQSSNDSRDDTRKALDFSQVSDDSESNDGSKPRM